MVVCKRRVRNMEVAGHGAEAIEDIGYREVIGVIGRL